MPATQLHQPTKAYATGILAPYAKASNHLAFVAGFMSVIEEDTSWETVRAAAIDEVKEAIAHLNNKTDVLSPFMSDSTIELLDIITTDIQNLYLEMPKDIQAAKQQVRVINNNIAYAMTKFENDMLGTENDEGTNP